MNQQPGHLTDAQIREYIEPGSGDTSATKDPFVDAHLADCESCLERVLLAQRAQLGLLLTEPMTTPYPGCPDEEILQSLAAGICSPEIASQTGEHAAHCDFCGPLLSRYMNEFSEELEPEEAAALDGLRSSTPQWQRDLVRKKLLKPERRSFFPFLGWKWAVPMAAAAAMAVVGVVFGPGLMARWDLHKASDLVASAYTEQRTTVMRLPSTNYAPYKPLPTELGAEGSRISDSNRPALLKALSMMADKTHSDSRPDPRYLQLEGRVALIQDPSRPEQAIRELTAAQSAGLNDPTVEIDLAAGYFERDSKKDNPNLSTSIDLLNKVLKETKPGQPEYLVALFDLALAYERSQMWDEAMQKWTEYLQYDSSSDWGKEAQSHSDSIKKKYPLTRPQGFRTPSYFLDHSADAWVREDLEQYQDIAFTYWLPAAIREPSGPPGQAFHELARLMEARHHDAWLSDFLRSTQTDDLPAVDAVHAAIVANQNDLHYEAVRESRKATGLFTARHNLPGELLARFQEVYALQRMTAGDDCLAGANQLWPSVTKAGYGWLQGQVALEKATCANLTTDFATSDREVDLSRKLAQEFGYDELALRVMGLGAGMKRLQIKCDEAWKESVAGLKRYWLHSYSTERRYQFYSVMRQCAKSSHANYAAEALLRRSIQMLQEDLPDNNVLRAMLYRRLATLLLEQRQETAAEEAAEEARRLAGDTSSGDLTARQYESRTQIEVAEFELQRERPELALSTLGAISPEVKEQDSFLQLDSYRLQGDAMLQMHKLDDAASAYEAGIHVAESSLRNLKGDGARLPWIRATDEIYRGLVQVLLARHQDEKALLWWEWARARSLHGSFPAARVPDPGKNLLPPVSTLHLIFASFPDHLQVWTVQGTRIESKQLAVKRGELVRRIVAFNESCANPNSPLEEARRQSSELYSLILQPVAGSFATSHAVSIEFDPSLPPLAIEALLSPDGQYVGTERPIVNSPGIFAEQELRPLAPVPLNGPFVVSDGSAADGPGFLPGHDLATKALRQLHDNVSLMTFRDANVEALKSLVSRSASFHFTGHTRQNGTGMALQISDDLFLRAQDLSPNILRKLQLAVLAACQSGSAENGILDADNLVRTLVSGGVPAIVASHWNVDSASTGELMRSFYMHLATEPAAQALRDARKDVQGNKNHPYYWAAFSLTGRSS